MLEYVFSNHCKVVVKKILSVSNLCTPRWVGLHFVGCGEGLKNLDGGRRNSEGQQMIHQSTIDGSIRGVVTSAEATIMVTATAVATTTDWRSANVARGKQATAKVKRRSTSVQHNNQPTTMRGTAKVATEKQVAHRSKEEEQRDATQQPTNN
jgi:hypothetical protein